jgi:tRNA threonylcarbamoyladenosine biosynthesis protein TsaB
MAKMTAFATGARIIAVNTLEAIAQNAGLYIEQSGEEIGRIATILDAKRKEFYMAVFERSGTQWVKTDSDGLMRPEEFLSRFAGGTEPVWLLGEGLVYYKRAFTGPGIRFLDEDYWPSRAGGVYAVGRRMSKAGVFADPATLEPQYLRQAQAQEKWQMRELEDSGDA